VKPFLQRHCGTLRAGLLASGSLLALAGVVGLATPARAGCNNHAPIIGDTVTCTTAAPNPDPVAITAGPLSSSVTININAGAQLTGNGPVGTIRIVRNSLVENHGSIQSPTGPGVNAQQSGNTVLNFGLIQATSGPGVQMGGSGTITNNAGGAIRGSFAGVQYSGLGELTLQNSGEIQGSSSIILGSGVGRRTITNNVGGTLIGGVSASGDGDVQFTNAGTVSSGGASFSGGGVYSSRTAAC
jgi:hypothetical protein